MALRNAFEAIATEFTLRRLLEQTRFSRDGQDRMRVILDNQQAVTLQNGSTSTTVVNAALQPSHFGNTSWNIMDAREPMRDQSLMAFQMTRNRWSIT